MKGIKIADAIAKAMDKKQAQRDGNSAPEKVAEPSEGNHHEVDTPQGEGLGSLADKLCEHCSPKLHQYLAARAPKP